MVSLRSIIFPHAVRYILSLVLLTAHTLSADEVIDNKVLLKTIGKTSDEAKASSDGPTADKRSQPEQRLVIEPPKKIFNEGYDDAKWGMDARGVKKAFPKMLFYQHRDDTIYYWDTIYDAKAIIFFNFANDKLIRVLIDIQFVDDDNNAYANKFSEIEQGLIAIYKEAESKIREGSSDASSAEADTILKKNGAWADVWMTSETEISLMLTSDNDSKLHLSMVYSCRG